MKDNIILSIPGIYVPPEVITNSDHERLVDTSDEWIVEMTGIKERRISFDLGVKEMGAEAAKDLLKKTGVLAEDIDEIIFATNYHDEEDKKFPCYAGYVASELGLKKCIMPDKAHGIFAGCTGLVYAIRGAYNNLLIEEELKKILVVGSEHLTDFTDFSDRNTCVLFGDGAGAYLLERTLLNEEGIIKNVLGGIPDLGNKEWPDGYLSLKKKKGIKLAPRKDVEFQTYEKEQHYLIMQGKRVFKFATTVMEKVIHDVLKGTDYSLKDVDIIIPHGANIRITDATEKNLKEKGFRGTVYTNLDKYGNTSTASIPIAANGALEDGLLNMGDLAINVAFGAGFTYGANLYRVL